MIKRAQKIQERINLLKTRHPNNALAAAKAKEKKYSGWLAAASIGGPFLIQFSSVLFPWDSSWSSYWKNIINISITVGLVILLIILLYKQSFYNDVVSEIENSREHQQQHLEQLKKQIEKLRRRVETLTCANSYYANTASQLGKEIKSGKSDLTTLSSLIGASVWDMYTNVFNGDNVTINLYELRNNKLKMLTTYNKHSSALQMDDVDNPILLNNPAGIDINDPQIKDYYCVRCLKSRDRRGDGKFILRNWKELVREFHWDKWADGEKEEILKTEDRDSCLNAGFRYNQYIGIKWRYSKDICGFLEVIALDEATFDERESIDVVARNMKDMFFPMISVIWDISTN